MFQSSAFDPLVLDETGLATARLGRYRLRSTYRIVYFRRGPAMTPTALEGAVEAFTDGASHPIADVCAEHGAELNAVRRDLSLFNLDILDAPELPLLLRHAVDGHADDAIESIHAVRERAAELDIDPMRLVHMLESVGSEEATMSVASLLQAKGLRYGLAGALAARSQLSGPETLRPRYATMEANSIALLAKTIEGAWLLTSYVAQLRAQGVDALAQNLDTVVLAKAALAAGFEHVEGRAISPDILAGTIPDLRERAIVELLDPERRVIPFDPARRSTRS